jgi:O-succinylbenzoic acid--CoA ligase
MPKGVVHSAANHLASADGLLTALRFTEADCWLLSLPLFHVSGQGIVWRWLLRGARLAVAADGDLAQALAGCSHASLVPTQLLRLLAQQAVLPALKQVLLGGAAIAVELTQRAEQAGIRCWCGYGMTEMASTVTAKRADASPGVGQTLPQRALSLVDGEVWVRGDTLALGYWRDGQIQPLVNAAGWFATRDRGVMLDGELRILGRLDNLFISGGENIQPEQIEALLAACPDVLQAFVVPVPDPEFGQRQMARYQWPVAYYRLPSGLAGGGIKIPRQRVIDWAVAEFQRQRPTPGL